MNVDLFIDTNILVYSHDADAGAKHAKARELIEGIWLRREIPFLSVQVLQELHVNMCRKGVNVDRSSQIVGRYMSWRVVDNSRQLLQQGFAEQKRWGISFWDALIVAAARRAGATTLWSEDMSEGQDYGGVQVANPLK
jgi:predicted nucleic acid-binding protein